MPVDKQELSCLSVDTLTPLSQEVIASQATINFGTIGHVAHGKSTVVKALSGIHTIRFKHEKERNITIKLGYANAKIWKCVDCPAPQCYFSTGSAITHGDPESLCKYCEKQAELKRHISFVDCPGHDILMATMLNGAAVMDAALLLVSANESCPQPQTSEHLAAVDSMRLKHMLILQNKIELVPAAQAQAQYEDIRKFVAGTAADGAPIVPISAVLRYNIDVICEYICTQIPVPVRNFAIEPRMMVIRSFDVNKPGQDVDFLKGGVAGGSIVRGLLKVGDDIEVRPGVVYKDNDGITRCTPIKSRIVSLFAENNDLAFAVPGGLIGVGTEIDPALTRSDRLVGQVLGRPGALPSVFITIEVSYYLLLRLLGVKSSSEEKQTKVAKLEKEEFLLVNVGSLSSGGRVTKVASHMARLALQTPVCTEVGDKIALSRRVDKHWRLIGWGTIQKGVTILD
eukprot:GHVL01031674.1.p1 GENE.GHVL01031674.1~~GHVL01031674.1.p1  ORF type:complete len:455 (+),score=66.76 GHVL01031674.1:1284-2648(+)